jgi:hypothetical protein
LLLGPSQLAERLDLLQEVTSIYRRLAARDPDLWRSELARILSLLAEELLHRGGSEDAYPLAREASEILAQLAGENPQEFAVRLKFAYTVSSACAPRKRFRLGLNSRRRLNTRRRRPEAEHDEMVTSGDNRPGHLGDAQPQPSVKNRGMDQIPLSETVSTALSLAIADAGVNGTLDTKTMFAALARTESFIDWYRIESLARDPRTLGAAPMSDPITHQSETWRGAPVTGSLAAAVRLADQALPLLSEEPAGIPAGVLVVALIADPMNSASRALVEGFGIDRSELLELVQEAVDDTEIMELVEDLLDDRENLPGATETGATETGGTASQGQAGMVSAEGARVKLGPNGRIFIEALISERFAIVSKDRILHEILVAAAVEKFERYVFKRNIEELTAIAFADFGQFLDPNAQATDLTQFLLARRPDPVDFLNKMKAEFRQSYLADASDSEER